MADPPGRGTIGVEAGGWVEGAGRLMADPALASEHDQSSNSVPKRFFTGKFFSTTYCGSPSRYGG